MTSSPKSASNSLSGKKALVTGAAGFIGSYLARNLVNAGCDTIVLLRPTSDLWRISDIANQMETVHGDIRHIDQDKLSAQLSGIDFVIHLGAAGIDQSVGGLPLNRRFNVLETFKKWCPDAWYEAYAELIACGMIVPVGAMVLSPQSVADFSDHSIRKENEELFIKQSKR